MTYTIIGGIIGIVGVFIVMFIADKVKILGSTKNIFGFVFWIFFMWFFLILGNLWYTGGGLLLLLFTIFDFIKNKRQEQAILNTVQYMINNEHHTVISVSQINQKLNYDSYDTVSQILRIYKSKALIPYNIDLVD